MTARVVILGAGFGGLELATTLSETAADRVAVTLIDSSDHFVFGFAKLDLMFGKKTGEAIKLTYRDLVKPSVRLLRETVIAIDPVAKRVTTDAGVHEADFLVIALGSAYDVSTTPGVRLGDNEFYSVPGAARIREVLPTFTRGHAVIGVCGAPYKCPAAPHECALMLHDYLVERGVRDACTISIVNPLGTPVPPSPDTSRALLDAFAERGITYHGGKRVAAVDGETVLLDDGSTLPCQLFLGVPKHRAPDVVVASGLTVDGWVAIDPRTLETPHAGVYAIGDASATGAPKTGVFAEAAGRVVAARILSTIRGEVPTALNPGAGTCFVEFGGNRVARIDMDFFGGPKPTGTFHAPSAEYRADKDNFGTSRASRWFGSPEVAKRVMDEVL
jgi:sulfide:quinone oxidoreductase